MIYTLLILITILLSLFVVKDYLVLSISILPLGILVDACEIQNKLSKRRNKK